MIVTASHVSSSSFLLVSASFRRSGAGSQRRRTSQVATRVSALWRPAAARWQAPAALRSAGRRQAAALRCGRARTAAGALGITDDVSHASLEAHERRQVRRLARIILREAVSCGGRARQRLGASARAPGGARRARPAASAETLAVAASGVQEHAPLPWWRCERFLGRKPSEPQRGCSNCGRARVSNQNKAQRVMTTRCSLQRLIAAARQAAAGCRTFLCDMAAERGEKAGGAACQLASARDFVGTS